MRSHLLISSCVLAWSIPACIAEAPEEQQVVGSFQLPLVTTSVTGNQYRLTGTLDISGPEPMQVNAGGDATSLSVPLRVGSYTLSLEPGWQLERLGPMATVVDATLSTATPVPFDIEEDSITPLTLSFQVQGEDVVFSTGTLEVDVAVEDEAFEVSCNDETDNDADGLIDCDDAECANSTDCAVASEQCSNMTDDDDDGLSDCADPDCAMDPACHVVACGDGLAEVGEYCFSGPQPVPVPFPGSIAFLAVGDFNGDMAMDMVAASGNGGSVVVLLRQGSTFVAGPMFNMGGTISGLQVADLNGTGGLDVVVANNAQNLVRGLDVDANGALSNMPGFTANMPLPRRLEVGDLNLDGRPDLVVGVDNQLLPFNNTGSNFAPLPATPIPGPLGVMTSADFNGDGRMDVAIGRTGIPEVRSFLANGAGNLAPAAIVPLPMPDVSALLATDVNGDGQRDLVVASASSQGGTLLNMAGTFSALVPSTLGPTSRLAAAQLDYDGQIDLIGGNSAPSRYFTMLNAGAGHFTPREEIPGTSPVTVAAGDVNGDGRADILLGRPGAVEIRASNP